MTDQVVNVGWKGKMYLNTGGDTPALQELKNVSDVKIPDSFSRDDATTRGDDGFETEVNTTRKIGATWKMIDKGSDNADLTAIRTAYNAGTPIEMYFMTGVATDTKSRGVRAVVQVRKFDLDQDNKKASAYDVEVSPYPSDTPPSPISGNASWTIS